MNNKKTYVITGSTSGIGESLVKKLVKTECLIFAGYRSESKKDSLLKISKNIIPFYIDYAKPETIKPAIEFILSHDMHIDTLVNIAGCVVAGPIEEINVDEIRRQFNVNVFGHIELTQGLLDKLYDSKIINVSSMASFGIFPFISPYCASKRALDMFFNSLLIENKHNLKIVSVKPGVISTPLWNKSIEENTKSLKDCKNYQKEMDFIAKNAHKNSEKGLSVDKVVDKIIKIDKIKNPKLSYTVGKDAFMASIFSNLPQPIINFMIRFGMKTRIKNLLVK